VIQFCRNFEAALFASLLWCRLNMEYYISLADTTTNKPPMNKISRFLLLALACGAFISLSSCRTAKKPHGCGCGMEEHMR
jgi:hypothetical protein